MSLSILSWRWVSVIFPITRAAILVLYDIFGKSGVWRKGERSAVGFGGGW